MDIYRRLYNVSPWSVGSAGIAFHDDNRFHHMGPQVEGFIIFSQPLQMFPCKFSIFSDSFRITRFIHEKICYN